MATGDKLKWTDFADKDLIRDALSDLDKLEKRAKAMFSVIKKEAKSMEKTVRGAGYDPKKMQNAAKKTNALQRERAKIEKQLQGVQTKKKVLGDKLTKQLNEEKAKLQQVNKAEKDKIKTNIASKGSIERLKLENNQLVRAYQRLNLETKKGRAEAKRLQGQIKRNEDQLKKYDSAIGRHQRNVGNYKSALQGMKMGYMAVAAAVAGVIRGVGKWMKMHDVQVRAEKSLEVALGRVSKALLTQASALQSQTRYGDEAIIQGQAFLAQMGATEQQILDLTPSILDMAEAKGMDLRNAFDLSAKAVFSSTNALSRYGIEIEGAAGSNEKVESAVKSLTDAFEGQASAAAEVGLGAWQQVNNSLGDLGERIGGFLGTALAPLARGMSNLLDTSEKHSTALMNERIELNNLINTATLSNTSRQARVRLLEEANEKFPKFLEHLNTEKVTNEDLRDRLAEVNTQYDKKIQLLIAEEIYKQAAEDRVELEIQETKLLMERTEAIKRTTQDQSIFYQSVTDGYTEIFGAAIDFMQRVEASKTVVDVTAELAENKSKQEELNEVVEKTLEKYKDLSIAVGELDFFDDEDEDGAGEDEAGSTVPIYYPEPESMDYALDLIFDFQKEVAEGEEWLAGQTAETVATNAEYKLEQYRKTYQGRLDYAREMYREGEISELEYNDRILAIQEEAAEKEKQLKQDVALEATNLAQEVLAFRGALIDRELEKVREQKRYELSLAGDNADARASIEEAYAQKEAEIRTKQAKNEKLSALFSAIINMSGAVMQALGTYPPPYSWILAAISSAIGTAQIAAIAAKPIPQYAEGTEFVELAGRKKGKDTVPAMLTEGERVVDVDNNRDLSGISNDDLPNLVNMGKLWQLNFGARHLQPSGFDTGELKKLQEQSLKEQKKTNKYLSKHKNVYPNGVVEDLEGNRKTYV